MGYNVSMGKMTTTSLDASGRLLLPDWIRKQVGFEPGMLLEIRYRNRRLEIAPASLGQDSAASRGEPARKRDTRDFLEREIWSQIPASVLGKPVSKKEREEILGYGPDGV